MKKRELVFIYFYYAISIGATIDVGEEATLVLVEVAVVGIGVEVVMDVFVAGVVFGRGTEFAVAAAAIVAADVA